MHQSAKPPFLSVRAYVVTALALSFVCFTGWKVLHDDGMVGTTRKNGFGCNCHDFQAFDSVHVWIEGPARVGAGSLVRYRLLMTGGPAVKGGLNIAAGHGALAPADTTTKLFDGPELTHAMPAAFAADTARWEFFYQAPADTTLDTLFSVGNSVDGNGIPTGDRWNYGPDFVIDLSGDPATGVGPADLPARFALEQNYPNPFNPSTTIRFEIAREGIVALSVADLTGRTVRTLLQERRAPGSYQVTWNADGMPSGVYFCVISAPGFSATRKMLLLR